MSAENRRCNSRSALIFKNMTFPAQALLKAPSMARSVLPILLGCGLSPVSAQWTQTGGPRGGLIPNAVAFTPTAMILADNLGIYRSTDSGATWTRASVGELTVPPETRSLLATPGTLFAGTLGFGLYKSADDGRTWAGANLGDENAVVHSLAADADMVFAGTDRGVFRSANGGLGWTRSQAGLSDSEVTTLKVGSKAILAGTATGLFRSMDRGRTWSRVEGLGEFATNGYALAVADTEFFVSTASGTFRSVNSGDTWVPAREGFAISPVYSMVAIGPDLFASDMETVYRSRDRGASWQPMSGPFARTPPTFLAASGERLYAGTLGGGMYRAASSDPDSWTRVENRGLPYLVTGSIGALGSHVFVTAENSSMIESEDAGSTWIREWGGVSNFDIEQVLDWNGKVYAIDRAKRLHVKDAAGSPWRTLISQALPTSSPSGTFSFAVDGPDHHLLNAGVVFRSAPGLSRWDSTGSLPSKTGFRSLSAYFGRLAAGGSAGVFLSSDDGKTWTPSRTDLSGAGVIGLRFVDSALHAATQRGMMKSDDLGETWRSTNRGIQGTPTGAMASGAGILFTATSVGVHYSKDGGESWIPIATGLGDRWVYSLTLSPTNLFATTPSGVWVLPLPDIFPSALSRNPTFRTGGSGPSTRFPGLRTMFTSGSRRSDALGRHRD